MMGVFVARARQLEPQEPGRLLTVSFCFTLAATAAVLVAVVGYSSPVPCLLGEGRANPWRPVGG